MHTDGDWRNNDSISTTDGTVIIDGTPTDLGSFSLDGSDLFVDGTLTTAQIDQLNPNNITLTIHGTLDNAGETLELGEGTAIDGLNLDGGTIRGGTVGGETGGRWANGQLNGGVQLDNSRYLSVPHSESIDPRRQVTVETWIYVDAFDSTYQPIFQKGNGTYLSTIVCIVAEFKWIAANGYG